MVFKVLFDHFISHGSNRTTEIASLIEVLTPVALFEFGEFLLDKARGASLEILYDF